MATAPALDGGGGSLLTVGHRFLSEAMPSHEPEGRRAAGVQDACGLPALAPPVDDAAALALQREAANRAAGMLVAGSRGAGATVGPGQNATSGGAASRASAGTVLALQRATGNRNVSRILERPVSGAVVQRCASGTRAGACTCGHDEEASSAHDEHGGAPTSSGELRTKSVGGGEEPRGSKPAGPVEVVVDVEGDEEESVESGPAPPGSAAAGAAQRATTVEVGVEQVEPAELHAGADRSLRTKASVSVKSGAPASQALGAGDYGLTMEESVEVTIGAKKTGAVWNPVVKKLVGRYSQQTRLLPGQTEITGPSGNTTQANFCDQATNLASIGNTVGNGWYMIKAVKRHENVHAKHFRPGLKAAEPTITAAIEAVSIPDVAGMKKAAAVTALKADPNFQAQVQAATQTWIAQDNGLLAGDHAAGGPTDKAEQTVTKPMLKKICKHAKKKKWPACAACP
jgi:hypothetical protein